MSQIDVPQPADSLCWTLAASCSKTVANAPFDISITVSNAYSEPLSAVIHLHPPLCADRCQPLHVEAQQLAPGESRIFSFPFRATQGGRALFHAWEGSEPGKDNRQSCVVIVEGAGFHSGDTHNHSTWSDGKGTLAQNRETMQRKGHSFLYSTDHNTLAHSEEVQGWASGDEPLQFCHTAGWEFTTAYGHALAYGYNMVYNPKSITSHGNLADWQTFIDTTTAKGAIVYLAHPYEAPRFEFGDNVLYGVHGMTGIEVWNGFNHHALNTPNRRAFDAWDNLNSRGERRYFGNAVSDAHSAAKPGDPFIKGWMERPSLDEIHRLLRTGAFYGSNGPELNVHIGDTGIGGVYKLESGSAETQAVFHMQAFDPLGHLERVTLYRNTISPHGEAQHRREIAFEASGFSGDERVLWEKRLELPIAAGQFYRVEATARYGASGDGGGGIGQGSGFAYTNPIWIEAAI
ncbi:MAG: hypothetical protein K0Q59_2823 [Paenibacillus sp.]|nr:hypothetical protein [Paenibacillus sp.]